MQEVRFALTGRAIMAAGPGGEVAFNATEDGKVAGEKHLLLVISTHTGPNGQVRVQGTVKGTGETQVTYLVYERGYDGKRVTPKPLATTPAYATA